MDKSKQTTFNIQHKGIWIDVDVKRVESKTMGGLVQVQAVRHADEDITPLINVLIKVDIEKQIINEELNTK